MRSSPTNPKSGILLMNAVLMAASGSFLCFYARPALRPGSGIFPWLLLSAAMLAGESAHITIAHRSETHSYSISEVAFVFGLLFFDTRVFLLARILSFGLSLIAKASRRWDRVVFNVGQSTVSLGCAALTMRAVLAGHPAEGSRAWIAVLVGLAVLNVVGAVLVYTVIAIAEHTTRHLADAPRLTGYSLVFSTAIGGLGLMCAAAARESLLSIGLCALAVLLLFVTSRSFVNERQTRTNTEFLYTATNALYGADSFERALRELLDESRRCFRCSVAEIAILRPEGDAWLRVRVGGSEPAAALPPWVPEGELSLVVKRGDSGPAGEALLDDLETEDAMLRRLEGASRLCGLVALGGSHGRGFNKKSARLLDLLAAQITLYLENSHLERSLVRLTALEAEMRHQANTDALTGLANRTAMRAHVDALGGRPCAIVLVDLDDFKPINDTYGHDAGDAVLKEVSTRLGSAARLGDLVVRLGGDEFAVVLGEIDDRTAADDVAARFLDSISAPISHRGFDLRVGASVGVAVGLSSSLGEIMKAADAAMYVAKRQSKAGRAQLDAKFPATLYS